MARNHAPLRAGAVTLALLAGVTPAGPTPAARAGEPATRAERCGTPPEAPGFATPARPGFVPDVRCMDLQLAQDKLQAAGFSDIGSRDASGYGRHQVYDRTWVVVAQTHAPGQRAPEDAQIRLEALRYGDPDAPPAYNRAAPGPVPRLGCFDLQEAHDTLESAGFHRLDTEDASGAGRAQIAWRNWTVVGQSPGPGGNYDKDTEIRLATVKDHEHPDC